MAGTQPAVELTANSTTSLTQNHYSHANIVAHLCYSASRTSTTIAVSAAQRGQVEFFHGRRPSDGGVGGNAQGGGIFAGSQNISPALTVTQTQVSSVSGFMDIINSTVFCNFAKGATAARCKQHRRDRRGGGRRRPCEGGGIFSNFVPEDGNEPISPNLVAGEFVNVVNSSVCSNTAKGGNGGNGGNRRDDGGDGGDGGYAEGGGVSAGADANINCSTSRSTRSKRAMGATAERRWKWRRRRQGRRRQRRRRRCDCEPPRLPVAVCVSNMSRPATAEMGGTEGSGVSPAGVGGGIAEAAAFGPVTIRRSANRSSRSTLPRAETAAPAESTGTSDGAGWRW